MYQGAPDIVTQWATLHNSLAQAWVKADTKNAKFVDEWAQKHPDDVAQFIKDNPGTPEPKAPDLAVVFFTSYAKEHPGMFPSQATTTGADGQSVTTMEPVNSGSDIQTTFFAMWREDNPGLELQDVPGDFVCASASGLDPHISMDNAMFQLDRVAGKWAEDLKRDPVEVRQEVDGILAKNAQAPWEGLTGDKFVNVLEVNLALRGRYGEPAQ
jgi:K+-transporting ATPase ATPase C chain